MSRPIGSPGLMNVDWEERVDMGRLRTQRLDRGGNVRVDDDAPHGASDQPGFPGSA